MKLIEYDNYQLKLSDEAYLVRPIRKLFNQDRSSTKEKFWQQISYLYFMTDPSSSYMYITDEEERAKEIILQEGLPKDFKPSKELEEAMEIYKKTTVSSSSLLLEDARYTADQIRTALRETSFSGIEDINDRVNAIKTATSTLSMIPKVVQELIEAEKAVAREAKESGRARGGNNKTIFEDGVFI